jgi:RNA polymerase sigma-70 factor (ECF subfamily)
VKPGPGGRFEAGRPATEATLVARARSGDVSAFEQLAGAHSGRLFAVLHRLLGDRSEAEDVAQEVMLRAWRGIGNFSGQSLFFTWLYRIAINEANRHLHRQARRPAGVAIDDDVLQVPTAVHTGPAARAEQSELRDLLWKALASLPPAYRIAIVLRDVEGLSTQDAADIAGIGQAAFKSRLHQARLRVRAAVGDDALIDLGS